jgi:HD superfamily phosphohydrolase
MEFLTRKMINDPVHGFITINDPLIFAIFNHSFFQRLRRIQQMALAQLVYPGAVHTRLHHSLGAYHLMCNAINELRDKGIEISAEEAQAAKAAILMHDIGHGPYSHGLENVLLKGVHHEALSLLIMNQLNADPNPALNGQLTMAIQIFTNQYPKTFLHQLISGQLDVDRLDYLSRDSFFTGVSEGVVGHERILKMLNVKNNILLVEEKGVNSVEKFLVSRRLMYWQVYRHKTVIAAENMLVKIIQRAKQLTNAKDSTIAIGGILDYFLSNEFTAIEQIDLTAYCQLDDTDIMYAIKKWQTHSDPILSLLCNRLLNRKIYKCQLQSEPITDAALTQALTDTKAKFNVDDEAAAFFCFKGETSNTLYKNDSENIHILLKKGEISTISEVQNALIVESLSTPVKKFYICSLSE